MKDKTARVMAALDGSNTGRLPFAAWMHLATQHLDAAESANLHERFFRRFDLDLMKVMNDYPYPQPHGVDQIDSASALRAFEPLQDPDRAFSEQLKVIKLLRHRLGPDVIILDTIFNPFGVAGVLAKQSLHELMGSHRDDFKRFLEVIADSLREYVKASLRAGATGVFYSVNGATKSQLTPAQFTAFVHEMDMHVLSACTGVNVCHAHGSSPILRELLDYPVHAFSWSHLTTSPTISEFRQYSDACVIGGINEYLTIVRRQPSDIRSDIRASADDAGAQRFIVGPGCSLATETPANLIDAARTMASDPSWGN